MGAHASAEVGAHGRAPLRRYRNHLGGAPGGSSWEARDAAVGPGRGLLPAPAERWHRPSDDGGFGVVRCAAIRLVLAGTALCAALLVTSAVAFALPKPEFTLGFKALAAQIPDVVGEPLANEYLTAGGDSIQQTTHGLLVWRKADNWTAFTNGSTTWVSGPDGIQVRPNGERFPWEATPTPPSVGALGALSLDLPDDGQLPPSAPRITSLNGSFLLLNMHGALFHQPIGDFQENVAYAQWMRAGVIRVFATDSNTFKQWDGRQVGNRIADVAAFLRAGKVKLLVALVNNHQPVPDEPVDSSGWMDGYRQLLQPFYTENWRGPYLRFVRDLISTVRDRGALDIIFAWELGNELHTPQDPDAIIPFITDAVQEIRRLDPRTPILPGTMGVNHIEPWTPRSEVARWLYCDAPIDAYTLHAYDWVSRERPGDMPISWDLDYTTAEPCPNGRRLPVIVEELGTSRVLPDVYAFHQEQQRLEQEVRQLRFVLGYPQVVGIGAWNGESPRVVDRLYHDSRRGLTSYGAEAAGGGSCYDPQPEESPRVRCQLEQILRNLPKPP